MCRYQNHSRWLPLALLAFTACGQGDGVQAQTRAETQVRERLGTVPAAIDTATAAALSTAFRGAADRALPAVVYVAVEQDARVAQLQGRRPPIQAIPEEFRRFFEFGDPEGQPDGAPRRGSGSGFIIDASGLIVTNNHVVADASRLTVRLVDGREYNAEVVGTDPNTDIALIRIQPRSGEQLPVVSFGDSDRLQVGDWVLALGNPLGLDFTVTAGIVSAKGRRVANELPLESFIQTDAAINMGNSGGPLVDLLGRVMGVNTAIFGGGTRFVGYGFAVPANLVQRVVEDLKEYGYARRPKLGAYVSDVTTADQEVYGLSDLRGADIGSIEPGSPADRAGLRVGDVIVALNGNAVQNSTDLITSLARLQPGEQVRLTIVRDRQRRDVNVTLGEFPREQQTSSREAPARNPAEELLGFTAADLTPRLAQQLQLEQQDGVVVTQVSPGSPALTAGLRPGHILLQINGQPVRTAQDVARAAGALEPGAVVSLRLRDRQLGETIVNYRTRG